MAFSAFFLHVSEDISVPERERVILAARVMHRRLKGMNASRRGLAVAASAAVGPIDNGADSEIRFLKKFSSGSNGAVGVSESVGEPPPHERNPSLSLSPDS